MATLAQAVQTQQCEQWCWAASISMIFAFKGHAVSQARIVQDTYGAVVCLPSGSSYTIGADLSRQYVDDNGQLFVSQVSAAYDYYNGIYSLSNQMIINELANNRPLLYANLHHAEVLYSVSYVDTPQGPSVVGASVIDPWPFSPRLHPLTVPELYRADLGGECTFLAAVTVT
jgi:hypothetical protein